MTKISRNEPCPCGSGKKYKNCCMLRKNPGVRVDIGEGYRQLVHEQEAELATAIKWLSKNHADAVGVAVDQEFFKDFSIEDRRILLEKLPEHGRASLFACLNEWLIANAVLTLKDGRVKASDLVLSLAGPKFSPVGQAHILELAKSNFEIFEVEEVLKGEGLRLRSMFAPDKEPVFVHDEMRSNILQKGSTVAARILIAQHGFQASGGMIYLPVFLANRFALLYREHPERPLAESTLDLIHAWMKLLLRELARKEQQAQQAQQAQPQAQQQAQQAQQAQQEQQQ